MRAHRWRTYRAWVYIIFGVIPAAVMWFLSVMGLLFVLIELERRAEAFKALALIGGSALMVSAGSWGLIRASQQPPCRAPGRTALKTCLLLICSLIVTAPLATDGIKKIAGNWQAGHQMYPVDFGDAALISCTATALVYFIETMIAFVRSRRMTALPPHSAR
ncbi:MAG: hypothetical protein LBQ09_05060 [Acidobacteriaceae bacterium]|jgi:vacuolar-type H+-ATPase subunit I/STV1|nr:hypothetical protein [Acidobacteriaceae bacterium]